MSKPRSKQKILWLHSHFLYSTGGTRFIYEVISELSSRFDIEIIVEKSNEYWIEKYHKLGVPVIELSPLTSTSIFYWLFFPFFLLHNLIKIRKYCTRDRTLFSSMFPMNVVASLLSKNTIYYCFEPFAFFYDEELIHSFDLIKQVLLRILALLFVPLDKWAVTQQRRILAINPSVGLSITASYNRSIDAYTYLGIDHQFFNARGKRLFHSAADEIVLIHSTDYSMLKGTHFLLESLCLLKTKVKWKLYISETVRNQKVFETYNAIIARGGITKNVHFCGHIPYEDLGAFYRSGQIYCFTGNPESKGATAASMSVLEASACGLAVIRSSGNNDEVISGETGLIIDPRDRQALSEGIETLLKSKRTLLRMRRNGPKHIASLYNWKGVAKTIERQIEIDKRT